MDFKRLYNLLNEDAEILDSGIEGKIFEDNMVRAFHLLDLPHTVNRRGGEVWDFMPIGDRWDKTISNKQVNIKVASTIWMFGLQGLSQHIPWEHGGDFDLHATKNLVHKFFRQKNIHNTWFMKPKNKTIQNNINKAVKEEDIDTLTTIFKGNNFIVYTLGNRYTVDFTHSADGNVINSIKIYKQGFKNVFMRIRKPLANRRLKVEGGGSHLSKKTHSLIKF